MPRAYSGDLRRRVIAEVESGASRREAAGECQHGDYRGQVLPLSLNPNKTRLVEFGRFAADQRAPRDLGKPDTFKFLGFTFICGWSRRGRFALKRKSRSDRMRARLKEIKGEMRQRRQPIPEKGNG
jgi:RNA-directed DNA polymerase